VRYHNTKAVQSCCITAGQLFSLQIKRVQNPTLYKQYLLLRKKVAKELGRQEDQVETTPLWHGTDVNTVAKITAGNFDRGYTGRNGILCIISFYSKMAL